MTKLEELQETVEKINEKEQEKVVIKAVEMEKSSSQKDEHSTITEDREPKDNNYCLNSTDSIISIKQTKEKSRGNLKNFKQELKGEKNMFQELNKVNMNGHIEKKNGLTYLSWTYAWTELKKRYPKATYKIKQFGENQLPYVYDKNTGYMVFTEVTIEDITHTMWLPVMDNNNKAMKNEMYTYDTKYKKGIIVQPATMFDINKTIMRCLVKNLAMFGLGLYIYAGEDLPIENEEEKANDEKVSLLKELLEETMRYGAKAENLKGNILKRYKVNSFNKLTKEQIKETIETLRKYKNAS